MIGLWRNMVLRIETDESVLYPRLKAWLVFPRLKSWVEEHPDSSVGLTKSI